MRRILLTVAMACALVIGGGGLAHALWRVALPAPDVVIQTSDFRVEAAWSQAPALGALFPGNSATGTATVRLHSQASWRFSVHHSATGPLAPHLSGVWYPNATCTGTARPMGQENAVTLAGGASTTICVRYTLSAGTPNTLQNATANVSVRIDARQVRP